MTTEQTERVDRLVKESSYVFKATVTQLNASNDPSVRPAPGLIVAHVDRVTMEPRANASKHYPLTLETTGADSPHETP